MIRMRTICDPLGNVIMAVTDAKKKKPPPELAEVCTAISHPNFIIEATDNRKYYFRMNDLNINVMIEVKLRDGTFWADQCTCDPSPEAISRLLKKGRLHSFDH